MNNLGPYRVVDLTAPPEAFEERMLGKDRYFIEETHDYHTKIGFDSHAGTHVEMPRHWWDGLPDLTVSWGGHFVRRGVRLLLSVMGDRNGMVTPADLERTNGGQVRRGDLVLLDSQAKGEPFKKPRPAEDHRPELGIEAALWLREKKVGAVAFGDGVAIEHNDLESARFHAVLMPEGVMLVENVRNGEALSDDIFLAIFAPPPIQGVDAFPVRMLAIEGVPGFRTEKAHHGDTEDAEKGADDEAD